MGGKKIKSGHTFLYNYLIFLIFKYKFTMTTFTKMIFKFCLILCLSAFAIPGLFAQVALFVNSPPSIEGINTNVGVAAAGFGPEILTAYTGDLALVDDGTAPTTDACESPLVNAADIAGNIALIDRGMCEFGVKVLEAEAAGAIAVIICNNVAGEPITMGAGAVGNNATIPSIMLTMVFCDQLKAEMANGPVNVSLSNAFNLRASTAAYAYLTPKDQILSLDNITTTISNRTAADQSNIVLHCDITDPSGAMVSYTETINTLPAGMDSVVSFTDSYLPVLMGEYDVHFYNNGANIVGYEEGIDEEIMGFVITPDQFGMDDNLQNPGPTAIGDGGNFGMGSLYTIVQTTDALSATFGISNPADLIGEFLTATLYQVDSNGDGDIDENGDGAFTDADVSVLGFNSYEISAADVPNALVTLDLLNFNVPGDPITLPANTSYILMVEYIGTNSFAITSSGITTYPGIGTVVKIGTDWFAGGFTSGINAVVRLNVSQLTNINEPQLEEEQVQLMPNPANTYVNIDLDLKDVSEKVDVTLLDITGRIIQTNSYDNVQQEVLRMDTQAMTAGTYFVHVRTAEGQKTLKLIIAGNNR